MNKNTKNETGQNMDGTIGKKTTENGRIYLEPLVLERNGTISTKLERTQPDHSLYKLKVKIRREITALDPVVSEKAIVKVRRAQKCLTVNGVNFE